jgi:hypothetical protein
MKQMLIWVMLPIMLLASLPAEAAGPPSNRIKQGPGLINELFGDDQQAATNKPADTTTPAKPADMTTAGTPQQNQPVTPAGDFDGIWRDASSQVVMIKQIHNTLYLSGSSDHAAWQAQCVISPAMARCLGNGISGTDGEFNYESDLHLAQSQLQIDWQRRYSNGRADSGKSTLQR